MKKTLLLLMIPSLLPALDISVKVFNATRNRPENPAKVSLLELSQGMKPVQTLENPGSTFVFRGLPEERSFPYMVQADYKGTLYSTVIPPMRRGRVEETLTVYETTDRFLPGISVRSLYHIRYTGDRLRVLALINFANESRSSFASEGGGIYFRFPDGAAEQSASVSVGRGTSDIEWLKLTPVSSARRPGFQILPHPVKPGGKTYQVQFSLPYSGKNLEMAMESAYDASASPRLILLPESVKVSLKEKPDWRPDKKPVPGLDAEVSTLPDETSRSGSRFTLVFSGGEALPDDSGEVKVVSPLSDLQRVIIVSGFLLIFGLSSHWLVFKSALPARWREQKLMRLRIELEVRRRQGADDAAVSVLEKKISRLASP